MAQKTWNIGERAVGGRIQATIAGQAITIKALDDGGKTVATATTILDEASAQNARTAIREFLWTLTTDFYVDKILDWISDNSILPNTDW